MDIGVVKTMVRCFQLFYKDNSFSKELYNGYEAFKELWNNPEVIMIGETSFDENGILYIRTLYTNDGGKKINDGGFIVTKGQGD